MGDVLASFQELVCGNGFQVSVRFERGRRKVDQTEQAIRRTESRWFVLVACGCLAFVTAGPAIIREPGLRVSSMAMFYRP